MLQNSNHYAKPYFIDQSPPNPTKKNATKPLSFYGVSLGVLPQKKSTVGRFFRS